MKSIFETVKDAVTVPMAAERYGLTGSGSLLHCPFHEDRTPSLKLYEDHFFCFGCGKHGDVVDLTSELFCIPPYDAACKLANDFGLSDMPANDLFADPKPALHRFKEDQLHCQQVLSAYLRLLREWKRQYEPTDPDAEPDDRYVEACQMYDLIDYLTDLLIADTLEQRVQIVDNLLADGKIDQLEERLKRIRQEKS